VLIRRADRDDAAAVAEIWHLGWRDGHLGFVPEELLEVRTAESFRERASARIDEVTVAVVNDAVAGLVIVGGDEVEQVYVSTSHRGTGVADALLAEAERQVRANDHATAGSRSSPATPGPAASTSDRDGATRGRSSTRPRPSAGRSTCPRTGTRSPS